MGIQQFSRPVEGPDGAAVSASLLGPIETDTYGNGGVVDEDGTAYPYSLDPTETIQYVAVFDAGDIIAEITTTEQDVISVPLASTTSVIDWWSIDSVTFKDPDGTTADIAVAWGGE